MAEYDGEQSGGPGRRRLARELHGLGGVHEGQVVVLAPGEDPQRLGEQLRSRSTAATVGVTRASGGVERIRQAWREARQALAALLRLGRAGEVSDPAGLGLARLLLGGNGPQELEEFIETTLGPVLDYDTDRDTRLAETLDAWFETGGALRDTAERLHIHPNTVTQRLDRVGQLLGETWREPGRKLDVQLALQMVRLRKECDLTTQTERKHGCTHIATVTRATVASTPCAPPCPAGPPW